LYIALEILTGLLDLIFRLHLQQSIDDWINSVDSFVRPIAIGIWSQIKLWSDQLGITAFIIEAGNALSNIVTEVVRGLILFVLFLAAGFSVYHLRVVHRVIYALLEFGVAVLAMWIAIDGMSGGDFSLKYIIALFSGLYIMVRGLQNAEEGIKEIAKQPQPGRTEAERKAWLDLWEAMFYDPYEKSTFPSRSDRIKKASTIIIPDLINKFRRTQTQNVAIGLKSEESALKAPKLETVQSSENPASEAIEGREPLGQSEPSGDASSPRPSPRA
jgi:hypothetical protein